MPYKLLLLVAFMMIPGCGEESEFDRLATEFGSEVEMLKEMNAQHADAVDRAGTIFEIRMTEEDHRTRMDEAMGMIGATVHRLEGCDRMGGIDGWGMMQGMGDELDAHRSRMYAAADVGEGRIEEHRHQERFAEDLLEMDRNQLHMMGMMGMEMDCTGE